MQIFIFIYAVRWTLSWQRCYFFLPINVEIKTSFCKGLVAFVCIVVFVFGEEFIDPQVQCSIFKFLQSVSENE